MFGGVSWCEYKSQVIIYSGASPIILDGPTLFLTFSAGKPNIYKPEGPIKIVKSGAKITYCR
jgi:hypothetical protein